MRPPEEGFSVRVHASLAEVSLISQLYFNVNKFHIIHILASVKQRGSLDLTRWKRRISLKSDTSVTDVNMQ